jgi:hypothetical protein
MSIIIRVKDKVFRRCLLFYTNTSELTKSNLDAIRIIQKDVKVTNSMFTTYSKKSVPLDEVETLRVKQWLAPQTLEVYKKILQKNKGSLQSVHLPILNLVEEEESELKKPFDLFGGIPEVVLDLDSPGMFLFDDSEGWGSSIFFSRLKPVFIAFALLPPPSFWVVQ